MTLTKIVTGVIADNTITTSDIATGTIVSGDILDGTITSTDMAVDPRNASNLSSGDVPLAQLDNAPTTDLSGIEADVALLAFKTQANGNLARYNLVDQSVDAFEDATGISAGDSTDANRDSTGKYYSGTSGVAGTAVTAFTTVGAATWTATSTSTIEVLVVAGGGRGGNNHGGGGGAGGVVHHATYPAVDTVEYDLTVGAGYSADRGGNVPSSAGADSSFNDNNEGSQTKMTALGGGSGAGASYTMGQAGGSGGGAGGHSSPGSFPYAGNQGNSGGGTGYGSAGSTQTVNSMGTGGGGGGAIAQGATTNPNGNQGGVGGAGKEFTTFGAYGTDSSNSIGSGPGSGTGKGYFGGGGGGGRSSSGGTGTTAGGVGGGGNGGNVDATVGYDALVNTGGGGGGGSNNGGGGGYGGSGIVLIASSTSIAYANMTLESITTTTATAPTKGDLVFTYSNGAGTAVLGTNITAEYSADAGTTWTDFGLAASDSQGTTGGHTIVTKNDVSLTSTSGTSMRFRIKTLVQSASIDTRIHAVSLGWS